MTPQPVFPFGENERITFTANPDSSTKISAGISLNLEEFRFTESLYRGASCSFFGFLLDAAASPLSCCLSSFFCRRKRFFFFLVF